ncbi:MAG: hypothetical protein J2P15_22810, partial [Micromonosporaceae bacterium]|nr:hypothetical protein [Micromonosporaceae bacterium]
MGTPQPVHNPPVHRGKVRELYAAGPDRLVICATDNISAFDVVLPTPIPDKGRILTALSLFWFDRLADLGVPNHVITADPAGYPPQLRRPEWRGRSMLVHRLEMIPVECVARAYLAGSGTAAYRATGAVCGVPLPDGLTEGSRLPEPIFT